jgi:hypothetical protein
VFKYDTEGNELWGIATGEKLNDAGNAIMVFSEDRLIAAGMFEPSEIYFGDNVLKNNGDVQDIYVHLKPKRQGRKTISFLAMLDNSSSLPEDKFIKSVLYPNPATDHFTISPQLKIENTDWEIRIYSDDGRLVKKMNFTPSDNEFSVPVHDLARGIFIVKLKSGKHVSVRKLIRM